MFDLFKEPFLRTALIASLIVGAACAYMGVHVVLRRIVFVGAALSQISGAGVGLALCAGLNPYIVSLALRSTSRRTTQESLIGVGYALASALAVLLVAKCAQAEAHVLEVLSGDVLTVTGRQVWLMGAVAGAAIVLHSLFHKQLLFSAFDAEAAKASGIRSGWWDLLFFLILGVVISVSMRLGGTLLVFAFLVFPAGTALLLVQRFAAIYVAAVAAASISTVAGLMASYRFDLPTGPTIVAASCVLLVVAWGASKLK